MAQYQIGNETYELPDDLPPQQIQEILNQLTGGQQPVDTSFSSAFQYGIDAPLENMATTARMLGAEGTASTLSGLTNAPQNYESASQRFINPQEGDFTIGGFAPGYLPRAAVEQAGQLAGSIATRAGGGVVGGIATGGNPFGVAAGALAGPALFEFVQQLGPIAQQRAQNNGRSEPEWDDWTAAAATAGVSGALNAIGVRGGAGASFLNKTLREGVTEGTQSVVEQTGSTAGTEAGLDVSGRQAIGEGIIGGTTAGGFNAAGKTVKGATRLFTRNNEPTDPAGAADLAERLNGIVEANNLNLSDLEKTSTKGARQAVDLAHSQLGAEMRQLIKDLKTKLKVDRLDPAETVADKVMAEAGTAEARTKTKSVVGQQEFEATERLVGDTAEGQRLLQLFRESNELTELHNSGYVGGMSQFTDQLSPFTSNVGYTARSAAELPVRLLGTAAGATMNPALPAAQIAALGTGRAVDAITGRRSRVARFIRQNQGNEGVDVGNQPSLRQEAIDEDERRQQREAQEAALLERVRTTALQRNRPPKGSPGDPNPSPEFIMQDSSGLDRQDVARALNIIKKTDPDLKPSADAYERMLRTGEDVPMFNELIRAVKGIATQNPEYFPNRKPEQGTTGIATERPGYLRGIEANRKMISDLKNKVDNDKSMALVDKELTKQALDQMGGNLGSEPVDNANEIMNRTVDAARNADKVKSYLQPYVDRVERQQKTAQPGSQTEIERFVDLRDPVEAPPKRKHREIGVELMREQQERYGRDLNPYEDGGDFETVANAMTDEARLQMQKTPDAAQWYDDDVRQALNTTAQVIPEINETSENKQLFLMLAALTSVGHKPRINWRYGGALALHYFRTGEIGQIGQVFSQKRGTSEERIVNPTTGNLFGLKAASIEPGIKILRHMVNTMGVADTLAWVNSDKTKAEIDAMRKAAGYGPQGKIKGGKNAVVKGIQMFGPKVGPFYLNLNGIHEVTVDLWASRTVRRHTGGLLAPNYKEGDAGGLVDAPTELERPTMKQLFTRVGENLGVTPQAAQAILWAYEQELYNDLGATLEYEKFSEGAEIFREQDAVAYEGRNLGSPQGQTRGREANDGGTPVIEGQRQLSFDFDERQPGRTDQGRPSLPKVAGSRPAEPNEIRDMKPVAQAAFEIGKPGSEYENGIKDVETAKKLADALGIAFYIANSQAALRRVFGQKGRDPKNMFTMGGAMQKPNPTLKVKDPTTGKMVKAVIGVLGEYKSKNDPRKTVTPAQVVWSALHELGHGIEGRFVPGKTDTEPSRSYRRISDQKPILTDRVFENTFRQAIASMMDAAGGDNVIGYSKDEAQAILAEVIALQRQGDLLFQTPTFAQVLPIRSTFSEFNEAIAKAEAKNDLFRRRQIVRQLELAEDDYFQTPQEIAADLIGFYLYDPAEAKKRMPKATKLVRDVLNKGDSPVKFYAMPLATLVAIILANMMVVDGEEDDERAALTLGQGALTA